MNIVIFASSSRSLSSLNSIVFEAQRKGHNIFLVFNREPLTMSPLSNKQYFEVSTNVEFGNENTFSETLGMDLPFNPDWLFVNRERWHPETSIILEFKTKFDCKVAMIEDNASIINSIEGVLETKSKNRFVPYVDVYFDHSEFISNQRRLQGFEGNLTVVGNPRYDINLDVSDEEIQSISDYYNVDKDKKQVLCFSLINSCRDKIYLEFEKYMKDHKEYQFFLKPYPHEPYEPSFKHQYFPKFYMDGITPIIQDSHIWAMFKICDIHMGSFSSILYPSFLLNKEVIDLSDVIGMRDMVVDPSPILNSTRNGVEDNSELWMRVFNLKSVSELENLLATSSVGVFKKNENVWNLVDSNINANNNEILNLYDDFNDNSANVRIIDYIENET